MGSLLFLIDVNDLPVASGFQTKFFAEDTSLHLSHKDIKRYNLMFKMSLIK